MLVLENGIGYLEGLEAQIIGLVLIAIFVALGARRLRIPYTVAMVLTGLGVSLLQVRLGLSFELEPELILLAFLPGLLFESAYHLDLRELRSNIRLILLLAIPGVILSMLIIGALLHRFLGLSIAEALLFGVLISATDPIAVIALFKELGVEKRLSVLVEGESLLNDGVAVVLYSLLAGVATGGEQFVLTEGIVEFLVTVAGGATLGLLAGVVISQFMRHNPDHVLDLALTTIASYGTYLFAEVVLAGRVSPVIAVVVAGIYIGNVSEHSATSNVTIVSFWEFIAFLLNSFVFLLIGLSVEPAALLRYAVPLGITIIVVLLARSLVVYTFRALIRLRGVIIPASWSHVLVWGGLRGAVSLALVLSLPLALKSRGLLTVLAFGYALFSLIVQGLTIKPLMRRLGLVRISQAQREYERERGLMAISEASISAINVLENQEFVSRPFAARVRDQYHEQSHDHWNVIREMLRKDLTLARANQRHIEREIASKQKSALLRLMRTGIISEEIYIELVREVDEHLVEGNILPPAVMARGLDIALPGPDGERAELVESTADDGEEQLESHQTGD